MELAKRQKLDKEEEKVEKLKQWSRGLTMKETRLSWRQELIT
jgi:hypothetical protein